jgi:hypothetical protein
MVAAHGFPPKLLVGHSYHCQKLSSDRTWKSNILRYGKGRTELKKEIAPIILGLLFVLVLTGSAFGQDAPATATATTEKATVVLYRPSRFIDAARKVTIYIDNRPLCVLSNGSNFKFEVATGMHSLATLYFRSTKGEVAAPESQFNFVPGQTYYFALNPQGLVFAVPAQKGVSESKRTKPVKESSVSFQPTGNEVK